MSRRDRAAFIAARLAVWAALWLLSLAIYAVVITAALFVWRTVVESPAPAALIAVLIAVGLARRQR